jgi:hypothetical protein
MDPQNGVTTLVDILHLSHSDAHILLQVVNRSLPLEYG